MFRLRNVGVFPFSMPRKLKRNYGRGDLHFITFSCYRRCALLGTAPCLTFSIGLS